MRRPLVLVTLTLLAWPAAHASAQAQPGYFKTPSGNIVCSHSADGVTCGIKSGLKPAPKRRDCHGEGDWQIDRIGVSKRGRGYGGMCAGDIGPYYGLQVGARVLAYGKSITDGGFRCTSQPSGLTCKYRGNHGFFVSRARWRTF